MLRLAAILVSFATLPAQAVQGFALGSANGNGLKGYREPAWVCVCNRPFAMKCASRPSLDQRFPILEVGKGCIAKPKVNPSHENLSLVYAGISGLECGRVIFRGNIYFKWHLNSFSQDDASKIWVFPEARLATAESAVGALIGLSSLIDMARSWMKGGASRSEAFPEMRPLWDTRIGFPKSGDSSVDEAFARAEDNSRKAAEMFFRARHFVVGWLAHADPKTGLIPRNLGKSRDIWNTKDSAADNYPFMVITCSLTDRKLFEGPMLDILETEIQLTRRIGNLSDTWSFKKQGFDSEEPSAFEIFFGNSEYVKDGLLPISEWLGQSPWLDRMLAIVDDLFEYADFDTGFGKVPTNNIEIHGELLQVLSRLYWMTGKAKYLDWACRLGDYYLLGDQHPTKNREELALQDHGCEIVSGLAELYLAVRYVRREKADQYRKPIYEIYDRILEVGRTPDGQFYDLIYPKKGTHSKDISDNWGYNYIGFYTMYLLERNEAYRNAVVHALKNLPHLIDYDWGNVSDEYADSIEGALILYNREPIPEAAAWMDSEIHDMWSKQTPDGVIEGWHGDGNVARTGIMYALWKTCGLHIEPWRADIRIGAEQIHDTLYIFIISSEPWSGRIMFDKPRHRVQMNLPMDYPRLNQFPEWFTVESNKTYQISNRLASTSKSLTGRTLSDAGLTVQLEAQKPLLLEVTK